MKKVGFIAMPLIAISLLVSCGNGGGDTPEPEPTYTIIFKNDGDPDKKIENIKAGSIVTENIPTPSDREGHDFIGWCTDTEGENVFKFSETKIYQDYTLYSGWKTHIYTVTLDAGDGTFSDGENKKVFNLEYGTKLLPLIKEWIPALDSNTFAYYEYVEKNDAIDYDDIVSSDITLTATYFLSSRSKISDLNNYSWKTIKNISVTGDPSRWFNIEATKKVKINEKDHEVRIIDFKHEGDVTIDGNQTGITFEFGNLITKSNGAAYTLAWDNTNNYDYRDSALNDSLNNETSGVESVINMLPSDTTNIDLKEVIVPVAKKVGVSINKDKNYESLSFEKNEYPKLFPLAHNEMANNEYYVVDNEGSKYKYYTDHTDQTYRVKKTVGGDNGFYYWLRSPYSCYNYSAWRVNTTGGLGQYNVDYSAYAIAPAFCI